MPRAYRMTVVDGVCTVRLVGEIDFANADQVTDWLLNAIDGSKCARLEVDFSELAFLDSSGIRALLTVYRHATSRDVEVHFRNAQPGVQRTLRLAGVESLLGTQNSEAPGGQDSNGLGTRDSGSLRAQDND